MKWAALLTGAGATVLLPMIQPVIVGGALTTVVSATTQQPAAAQSVEAVAKVAQAITVRIEGATQGSGVLVKRDGNRYTVLTAWHVVSGLRPGEELDINTPDGKRHQFDQGSIKRLGNEDAALILFSSPNDYAVATLARDLPKQGSMISVCGYSNIASNSIYEKCKPRIGTFLGAGTESSISTRMLYNSKTEFGYSGGAVLNAKAELLGIHVSGNRDYDIETDSGYSRKTGINEGLHIKSILNSSQIESASFPTRGNRQYEPYRNPKELELCADLDLAGYACSRDGKNAGQLWNAAGTFNTHSVSYTKVNKLNPGSTVFEKIGVSLLSPVALLLGNNPFAVIKDAWLNENTDLHVKARIYSERNNRICGVMVTRFGPNYEAGYKFGEFDPRYNGSLWESQQKANEEVDRKIDFVNLLINGRKWTFVGPSSPEASSPNLLGFEYKSYSEVVFDPGVWGRGRGIKNSPRKVNTSNFMLSMASRTSNTSATFFVGNEKQNVLRIIASNADLIDIKLSQSEAKKIARLLSLCDI